MAVEDRFKTEFELSPMRIRRFNPFATYVLLLAGSIGGYLLYTVTIVPFVQVAPPPRPALPVNPDDYSIFEDSNDHHQWFPSDAWERQPCSVLHTAHGKILFDDVQTESEKVWLVKPFSLVLERRRDADAADDGQPLPPLVLRCDRARLNFDSPVISSLNKSGNRLESAFLEGKVELFRRESRAGQNDEIQIQTRNVQITDDQILALEDVDFQFGSHHGVGRNMAIQLAHSTPSSPVTHDFSKINGLSKIRLGFLRSLKLRPTRSHPQDPGPPDNERLLSTDKSPVEINAAGPFEFDLQTNEARFEDQVVVRKLDGGGDSLQCNALLLKFKSDNDANVFELDAATDTRFELSTITASGSPAVLNAPSKAARVAADQLHYDLDRQTLSASSEKQVRITDAHSQFLARSIEYQLAEGKSLGTLEADGPGQLIRQTDSGRFQAAWSQHLSLQRVSDQKLMVVLTGHTQTQLDAQTSLRCDELKLWIWQVPIVDRANEIDGWDYQPEKLVASGNVAISSEKMTGAAAELTASWPANPKAVRQAAVSQRTDPPGWQPSARRRSGAPLVHTHVTTRDSDPPWNRVRRVAYQADAARAAPLMVGGQKIHVLLEEVENETRIIRLDLEGNVSVGKPKTDGAAGHEFEIQGSTLELIPRGEQVYQVHVRGRPARVTSAKLNLTGPDLFLDQSANRLWINGMGQLKLFNGSASATAIPVTPARAMAGEVGVSFDGGMVFDGQQVYFERGVQADIRQLRSGGEISETRAAGGALSLTLDRSFDFRALDGTSTNSHVRIVDLILLGGLPPDKVQFQHAGQPMEPGANAVIENQTATRTGQIREKFQVISPRTEVNESSGELLAYGPGAVQIYRPGQDGAATSGFGLVGNPTSPPAVDALTYIHTNFDKQLTANRNSNEIVMTGNLRSLYAPVSSFDQTLDPDQATDLPAGSVQLTCDRINITQSVDGFTGKTFSTFTASGQAHIRGETFQTRADRIRYEEAEDLMTVESNNQRQVVLSFRRDLNSGWQSIVGSRVLYRPRDRTGRAENVGSINIRNAP